MRAHPLTSALQKRWNGWWRPTLAGLLLSPGGVQADNLQRFCISTKSKTIPITVEIADSGSERSRGLMGRNRLEASHGMLFVYPTQRPPDSAFWMYHTRIALDIAWIGPQGDIRAIRTMTPCTSNDASQCRRYKAGVYYTRVLEMNHGFFNGMDVTVGDQVTSSQHGTCTS